MLDSSRGYLYVLYMEKFRIDHGTASWPDSIGAASPYLSGIGYGTALTCFSIYTLTYFDKYRATATGIKYASCSAAGLVGPTLLSILNGYYGFYATLLLSGALMIQSAPLVLLLRHPRPLNIRCKKRNTEKKAAVSEKQSKFPPAFENSSTALSSRSVSASPESHVPDAPLCISLSMKNTVAMFATLDFYILVAFLVTFEWSTSIHGTTAVDYGRAKGATLEEAKHVSTIGAFGYLAGRTLVPLAADRIPFSRAPFVVAALITSFMTFLAPSIFDSFECFIAFSMILGVCEGYASCVKPVLISEYLGIQYVPILTGIAGSFILLASLSGPTVVEAGGEEAGQTWLDVEEPGRGSSDLSGCGLEVSAGSHLGPNPPSKHFEPSVVETSPGRSHQASLTSAAASASQCSRPAWQTPCVLPVNDLYPKQRSWLRLAAHPPC
ncbi:hypothetical protein MTO96_007754 [Rhipicephalus appendiculatus]